MGVEMEQLLLLARARRLGVNGEGRRRREAHQLSLHDLAPEVRTDPATLMRWENGAQRPRRDAALRWLTVLDQLDDAAAPTGAAS